MRRLGVFLAVLLSVTACSSIPLSTALHFATMSPSSVTQIEPTQIRVRLSVSDGYELDIPACRLALDVKGRSGTLTGEMRLSLLEATHGSRSAGLFGADSAVSTYVLALSPEGVQKLKELQQFIVADPAKDLDFNFTVEVNFSKTPPKSREAKFWADLKLSEKEPYRTLFDGAKLHFDRQAADS